MINRDLTPDEVESLLPKIKSDSERPATANATNQPPCEVASSACGPTQMAASINDLFQVWTAALAAPLRADVQVGAQRCSISRLGDFAAASESPACIEVLEVQSDSLWAYFQIDRALVVGMIDRLLGGGQQPPPLVRRPLTEIEVRLFRRLTSAFVEALEKQIADTQQCEIRSVTVESQPKRLPSSNEPLIVVDAKLSVAEQAGHCRFAVPQSLAETLHGVTIDEAALLKNIPQEGVAVIAGSVQFRCDPSQPLKVGQTLMADRGLPRVYVNRKLLYAGRLGASDGNKAVQIVDTVD